MMKDPSGQAAKESWAERLREVWRAIGPRVLLLLRLLLVTLAVVGGAALGLFIADAIQPNTDEGGRNLFESAAAYFASGLTALIGIARFFHTSVERALAYVEKRSSADGHSTIAILIAALISAAIFTFGAALMIFSFNPKEEKAQPLAILMAPYPLASLQDGTLVVNVLFSEDATAASLGTLHTKTKTPSPALYPRDHEAFLSNLGAALAACAGASGTTPVQVRMLGFASTSQAPPRRT